MTSEWQEKYGDGPNKEAAEAALQFPIGNFRENFSNIVVYIQFQDEADGPIYWRYGILCYITRANRSVRFLTPNGIQDGQNYATVLMSWESVLSDCRIVGENDSS